MNNERINYLKQCNQSPKSILYVCHNAFRLNDNHAIQYIIQKSSEDTHCLLIKPIDTNPVTLDFFKRSIVGLDESFLTVFSKVSWLKRNDLDIKRSIMGYDEIVIDKAYLKEEKDMVQHILDFTSNRNCNIVEIESNVIVPVMSVTNKLEYSARTIRPKIWKEFNRFDDIRTNHFERSNGELEALNVLSNFIHHKLKDYTERNHPGLDKTSGLSKYLKFGFISPLTIVHHLEHLEGEVKDSFLEELVIRRELSYNFVYFNSDYNVFSGLTYEWAYRTMDDHINDERQYIYTIDDYIHFRTHDIYFNTAMKEMVFLGTMHGYMRMYWCKKIIEWSKTYEEAYNIAMYLNNYYFIDGNSPNGYTGVAWCFGRHDRAWTERLIFGKLRYMNQNGLLRKFDMDLYIENINKKVGVVNE